MAVPRWQLADEMFLQKTTQATWLPACESAALLLLVTHHEIARVLKFGDIWSFSLNQAAFGISFPGIELFLGTFQTCT